MTVVPTFPHAKAEWPPVRIMCAVSSTVDVFPFVPVRPSHFWEAGLRLHARSISLIIEILLFRAATTSG